MSEFVDVPIIGRLELFLLESAWISFFIKWPESSRVVFSKSLNFFTIYNGSDERFASFISAILG